MYKLSVAS